MIASYGRGSGPTVGALMIRTGCWGFLIMSIVEKIPPHPILIVN